MTGNRVLLVDDEEEFADALAERMEARGLRVDVAHSGEEALDKARARLYEAIVLDLAMPGLDGIETLKRLLKAAPPTGIEVCGNVSDQLREGLASYQLMIVRHWDGFSRIEQAGGTVAEIRAARRVPLVMCRPFRLPP